MSDEMRILGESQSPPPCPPLAQPVTIQIVQPRKPWWRFFVKLGVVVLVIIILGAIFSRGGREGPLLSKEIQAGQPDQVVAVYNISGVVDGDMTTNFETFVEMVEESDAIKAVVLRVNSPGGAVSASERMHHLVQRLSEDRPVVISMGSVAASGGYMLSCGADTIVAEDATITGSIGVIAGWMVFDGTMELIGATPMVIKSTDADYWKDDISPWHQPDDEQILAIREMLDEMQGRFNQIVIDARPDLVFPAQGEDAPDADLAAGDPAVDDEDKDEEAAYLAAAAAEPLNGRVYTASQALELGLIDEIGFIERAIDIAAEQAGLDEPQVNRYYRQPSFFEAMMTSARARLWPIEPETLDDLRTPRFEAIYRVD
jgi:protease-4